MKKQLLILSMMLSLLSVFANAQSWSLTGNSGTLVATNYVGTADGQPLEFKVNGQKAGYIDYTLKSLANTSFGYQSLLNISGSNGGNSSFGFQSLYTNTTGAYNTAAGQFSLYSNLTGASNTAFGVRSLYNNTSGNLNTALGNRALYSNTSGYNNTAVGNEALYSNASGVNNIAIGNGAMYASPGGIENVAIGDSALYSTSDGYNIAIGSMSLFKNTDGYEDIAIGRYALYKNKKGAYDVAIGFDALKNNTIGKDNVAVGSYALINNTTGNYNVAVGYLSLENDSSGYFNTGIGNGALYSTSLGIYNTAVGSGAQEYNQRGNNNTSIGANSSFMNDNGSYNTGLGYSTLYATTESSYNTAIGYNAGTAFNNGNDNLFVGAGADVNGAGYVNVIAIGEGAVSTASNQVTIGNAATISYRAYANWTNISDGRVKKNIKQNVPGLAFINKLQPITYNLDLDAADRIIQKPQRKDSTGKIIQPSQDELDSRKVKEQIVYTGFIAQDVETAAKSLDYDFSGVDAAKNDKDLYGLRYAEFVVPIIKGEQELSSQNDSLKKLVSSMQSQIDELRTMMQALANKDDISLVSDNVSLSSASLSQNVPNPFKGSTTVGYVLPQQYSSAQIIIRDNNGTTLKAITVSGKGKGSLNIDASTIANGAYNYSLLIDGRLIDTKQMILAK